MDKYMRDGCCSYCGRVTKVANKGPDYGLCPECMIKKSTGEYILSIMAEKKERRQ